MLRQASPLILMALLSVALQADELVVTRASIEPSQALPAAPFWISIAVKNTGSRTVSIPQSYVVEVTPESGEPFLAYHITSSVVDLPHEYKSLAELLPGDTRQIEFATGSEIGDGLLFDKRLWLPGTYRIRLILSSELQDTRLEGTRWMTLLGSGALSVPALVAPAMTLEVVKPAGVDASAWETLMKANHGIGLLTTGPNGPRIARDLWEKFPDSGYAPYFVQAIARDVLRNGGETRRQAVAALNDKILRIDSVGILAEGIRLGRARTKALEVSSQPDLKSAIQMTVEARADLEACAIATTHELTRLKARAAIGQLKSPEALRELFMATGKSQ